MLDPAGVLAGGVGINTELHEDVCDEDVLLIGRAGDFHAGLCEADVAILVDRDLALFAEMLHRNGYGWLREAEHICDVNRADDVMIHREHQDTLKIIF